MPTSRFAVTDAAIDVESLTRSVVTGAAAPTGAVSVFLGLVRAENAGRTVLFLEYEAYEPLALRAFERIAQEIASQWPDVTLGLHHRVGRLEIGEASIAIVAASAHRAAACAASRYAIERAKQIAPVWKHEHFEGGDVWIEGARADPGDDTARLEALRRACA
jgi:molybdopterin synthase catalytic subunit